MDIMYDNNFVLYDIVSLINRPYDEALGGGDLFFIKNSSRLRDYKGWSLNHRAIRNGSSSTIFSIMNKPVC